MLIKHAFNENEVEVVQYHFDTLQNKSIHIQFNKVPFSHCFVLIRDPKQQVRGVLTFKTRNFSYVLTEDMNTTTQGLLEGKIIDGVWTLEIVRVAHLKQEDVEIEISMDQLVVSSDKQTVLFQNHQTVIHDEKKWYATDLHMHSMYSDGRVTHKQILDQAIAKKLDAIAITDHSIMTTSIDKQTSLLVLPSTEITCDDLGHYNIHGLKGFIDYGKYFDGTTKCEGLEKLLECSKAEGCFITLNHPFTIGRRPLGDNLYLNHFHGIEVVNSFFLNPPEVDNDMALDFFDYLWMHNYLLVGVGGSDAHKTNVNETYPVGIPTTFVHCDSLSIESMIDSLKSGKSYLCTSSKVQVKIEKDGQELYPGTKVQGFVDCEVQATEQVDFNLIKNGKIIETVRSDSYRTRFEVKENDYYRVEAKKNNQIMFFMNPIHCKEQNTESKRLLAIVQEFRDTRV